MSGERRRRAEALFEDALRRPPEERAGWLRERCEDRDLLREVEELLAAHALAEGILDARAGALLAVAPRKEPRRIGVYRVIRELGRGGMGVVYLAERDDGQFRRRVALKLLRTGPDAEELRERFQAERQILASLDHPGIAQLLDSGVTDGHLPYLVMEYVEGLPITEHCDRQRLGVEARLELFRDVCAAVHHAHRNLVIHRDLKPGNVLVTAGGQVKLLDFGIAKLLNPGLGPVAAPVTRTELRVMTPEYASPEQVLGEPLSTASDVYALGVVLYELLTGRRPYDLTTRSPAEVAEWVCQREPDRPSAAVTRAGSPPARVESRRSGARDPAAARDATPERLRRALKGDLDAIVMMALRKEPSRRYGSADLLAADVQRYLEGLPVLAHRGNRRYRTLKFLSRHRAAAAAAAVVAISLVGGAGVALWQASLADAERDRAEASRSEAEAALAQSEEVAAFLLGLFQASEPDEALGSLVTARELLERGVARADQLGGQPLVQARMFEVVGRVYRGLGEYERARPLLAEALSLRERHSGAEGPEVATSLIELGHLLVDTGDLAAAESRFRRALDIVENAPSPEEERLVRGLIGMGRVRQEQGDYHGAEALFRDALARQREALGDDHPEVLRTEGMVATTLHNRGEYGAAEEILLSTLALRRRVWGEDHPEVARTLIQLATIHAARDERYDLAEGLHREALAIRQRVYGDEHPAVAKSLLYVAGMLSFQGKRAEAEPLMRQGLELQRRLLGPRHTEVAGATNSLALLLQNTGRMDEAEALYRESIEIYRETLGDEHHFVASVIGNLARVAASRGDLEQAEALFREALERRRRSLGGEHPFTTASVRSLAGLLLRRGAFVEAEALYREALGHYQRRADTEDEIAQLHGELLSLYEAWGRPEEATRYAPTPGGT